MFFPIRQGAGFLNPILLPLLAYRFTEVKRIAALADIDGGKGIIMELMKLQRLLKPGKYANAVPVNQDEAGVITIGN